MVSQTTQQLIERLRLLGESESIEEGTIILMGLRKINGLYVVDEITDDKVFPVTIKSTSQFEERRYDITKNQYMMGRVRYLFLMNNGRLKKRSNKC